MKPLYTEQQFNNTKSRDTLPCKCYNCDSTFKITKKRIQDALNPNLVDKGMYCSIQCSQEHKKTLEQINCYQCNCVIEKRKSTINRNKFTFCSNSCRTQYYNQHKTWGSNRSKLEKWVEDELTRLYPNLEIRYNDRTAIGLELDIYIPSVNIAFEINGIFHYEPIFGVDKLNRTIKNDKNKFKICHEQNISLCVINTSEETYFKPKKCQRYLDIITEIINQNID